MSEKQQSDQHRHDGDRARAMGMRFLRQAEQDLVVAQRNMTPGSYYVTASLAHQAAEKALKAAHWYVRGEEPPWNHDLGSCAERVAELTGIFPGHVDQAIGILEPLFERIRYPSSNVSELIPAELIQDTDALVAVDAASEVVTWVQTLFPPLQP